MLLSAGRDRSIKVWQTGSKWTILKTLFPPHYDSVTCMAVSPQKQKFFSVSRDKSVKEWDITTWQNTVQQLHSHTDWVTSCCVDNNENYLFTGGKDCVIKMWHGETLRCLDTHVGHRGPISQMLCMKNYLFSASHDRTVRVWKIQPPES